MYWIGYDIGSSSVKASLIDGATGAEMARVQSPKKEMPIHSPQPGWGEQPPEIWWENLLLATGELLETAGVPGASVQGIGISYQMHGLVAVDRHQQVVRPSIIWCDSRAVATGDGLYEKIGEAKCRERLLNAPGNFTLSKLVWVRDHEPETFARIHKIMLPGDYIAMKCSGQCTTTASGLSEGILWDFKDNTPAWWMLEAAGISPEVLPERVPTFGEQCTLSAEAASQLGLKTGTPILYRAGDQPNNALALNVMEPGEIAATGGTSGVVYAVTEQTATRELNRVNHFAHVNHQAHTPRIGKLLCINGTGIQYSWMQHQASRDLGYPEMNEMAERIPVGSEGLRVFPFGNGAERMLGNVHTGAAIQHLDFNIHKQAHLYRAALEGIAFSFVYGMEIMAADGVSLGRIRAGNDNLFRARPFAETITTLTGASIEMVTTTGAAGAARAAAVAGGAFKNMTEATSTDQIPLRYAPGNNPEPYRHAYGSWKNELNQLLKNHIG
ncbi:FGGY family carbohydrate kinase [Robiginitalea sp. M366]|uniref:xylulokinase n=1 Tax=Robiginitalea aestuariiviva TaxID=3036903 RepID=UPI00240D99F0|nr:FGGY family carbohydrate kinase [Robiginitalea aestuariiviva]MDG1571173.1 FGGY family carbohydrate kinase [Robiginitalea aestuariiviva]